MYQYRGYFIRRGGYQDTPDNRIDGWYVDNRNSTILDRRGPGYRTIKAARDAINDSASRTVKSADHG
jgi:hypothetical protein